MGDFNELSGLAPAIIKFPIEQTIKACINLKLGRKKASSIVRLLSLCFGLFIGYCFPQIGGIMVFLIGLVTLTPMGSVVLTGITIASSMFLSAVVMMYISKKSMQYYYLQKYGVSNPENRFTDADRDLLINKFSEVSSEDLKKILKMTDIRIRFLANELHKYKALGQHDKQKNVKYVLNCLKRGELSIFSEYCSDELGKSSVGASLRQKKLLKLLEDEASITHIEGITGLDEPAQADKSDDDLFSMGIKAREKDSKDVKSSAKSSTKLLYDLKRKSGKAVEKPQMKEKSSKKKEAEVDIDRDSDTDMDGAKPKELHFDP